MIDINTNKVICDCKSELDNARADGNVSKQAYAIAQMSSIDRALDNSLINDYIQVSDSHHQRYLSVMLELIISIDKFQRSGQRAGNVLFSEFSQHEIGHSYTVMNYMHQLFGNANRANSATYFYLIMIALCHDLGMTIITSSDFDKIRNNGYWVGQDQQYNYEKVFKSVNENEHDAMAVIVRNSHYYTEIIKDKVQFLLNKDDYDILSDAEWELIYMGCHSHGCSIDKIKETIQTIEHKNTYVDILTKWHGNLFDGVNFALICSLLRICDLLDISATRIGDYNSEKSSNHYNIMNGFIEKVEILDDVRDGDNKHCISGNGGDCSCKRIEKYIKIIFNENELRKLDNTTGKNESYESAYIDLLKYFEQIESELKRSKELLDFENITASYTDKIKPHINERIRYRPEKNKYLKISVDEDSVLSELMSDKLYGSSALAVRELLQNAFDACQAKLIKDNDYLPKIRITYQDNTFSIRDNGIGMSLNTIENYFLKAGKSLYKSNEYKYSNSQFFHAGRFGMGVFSVFMLTKQIIVTTASADNLTQEYRFIMKKNNRYVKIDSTTRREFTNGHTGTKIEFVLDDNVELPELKNFIERKFLRPASIDKPDFKIYLNGNEFDLLSLDGVFKKQRYKHNLRSEALIRINLEDYLENVIGYVYLEKCYSSIWWYDAKTSEFVQSNVLSSETEVAIIEVFEQASKHRDNKIVRFIIPWDAYYANTNQDLNNIETIPSLETLMGHDFSKLCDDALINTDKLSIKRFRSIYNGIDKDNGNEISGSRCDTTNNKLIYLNNILVAESNNDFSLPLPMSLPYRVSCFAMNIINFDNEVNKEIELLIDRNNFTKRTYGIIQRAVQYAILKFLSEPSNGYECIDLSEYFERLSYQDNFLIKKENA